LDDFKRISLGEHITTLTDYHANGSYEILRKNVQLKAVPDYAVMIRTLNFERPDFKHDLIYLNEIEYNYLEKTKVYPNDILMNKIANPGSVYLMPDLDKPVSLAMNLFLIRFDDNVNQVFMFYLMKTNERYIKKFANGTTTLTITKDAVRGLCFNVPSKPHQDKIAKTLTNLDQKIALNNQINTELEAMAKLIYDYWFVQFDFPDANGKPYKSSGGKMVYNEALKREIPERWGVGNIMQLTQLLGGGTPKTTMASFWGGSIPFFTPADASSGVFSLETKQNVTTEGLKSCSSKLFKKGTIFVTARGTVGKINIASCDMAMNQSCYALQGKEGVGSTFIYFYANELIQYVKSKASGSIFKALVTNDFKFTELVIPPVEVIARFSNTVDANFNKLLLNGLENRELTKLRDWLLPMLMNGQVTVKDTAS